MNIKDTSSATVNAALEYAARGWQVFPAKIEDGAKKGCIAGKANGGTRWGATSDINTIRRYWQQFPEALLGIATGPASDLFVIDADTAEDHAADGVITLRDWIAEYGDLPQTVEATTPSGGRHLYFRLPGFDVKNSAGKLSPGIDVRAEGGMVIAPPSYRADKGAAYSWKNPPGLIRVADCPEWLLDRIKASQAPKAEQLANPGLRLDLGAGERWGAAILRGELARVLAASHGERNSTLNHAAFRVGQAIQAGGIDEPGARQRLLMAARFIGLDDKEARATIESGLSSGRRSPRGPEPRMQDSPDYQSVLRGSASIQPAATRESKFYSAALLKGKPIPPRQWLVHGLIPQETVTLLSGDGGTGKSLLALQLSVAVTAHTRWIGKAVNQGGAIFLSAEDDDDELHRRLDDILRAEGRDYDNLSGLTLRSLAGEDALLAVDRQIALMQSALFEELDKRAAEEAPAFIVIDTLADVYPANENDRAKVRQFVSILRGLAIKRKCAVLLLGHPSLTGLKSGAGTSGSTAWNNSVRSRLYLSRITENGYESDPDVRVLSTKKANYGRTGGEINLKWEAGVFVVKAQTTGFDAPEARAKGERVFLKLLDILTEQGRYVSATPCPTYAPTQFESHPEAEGCTKRAFKSAMDALFDRGEIVMASHGRGQKARSHIARSGGNHDLE